MPDIEEEIQIVIPGVPKSLVDEIDKLAAGEDRKRSSYVRKLLQEIVASKRREQKAA